jgi:endonuclease/exonuclease/phosphatase family metal-dependent hydrolase
MYKTFSKVVGVMSETLGLFGSPAPIAPLLLKVDHPCVDFCISSYNVDGLSAEIHHSRERCSEISRLLINKSPDVIFLQEVTPQSIDQYTHLLGQQGYNLVSPQNPVLASYFTVAFSKLSGHCKRFSFPDSARSKMGRDVLSYEIIINNRRAQFLSSHLESLADGGEVRKAQMEYMLELIDSFSGPSVMAGDLNIRNKEAESLIVKLKKKAKDRKTDFKIFDCWESMGKNENSKNTWVFPDPASKHIQARYDRMYCNGKHIKITEFSLIGKEVMPAPISTTPSDHFGMIARFIIENNDEVDDQQAITDSSCSNSEVVESSSSKEASRDPNTSSEDVSKSIDSPTTAKKAKAQSPKKTTEKAKRKHTDELNSDNGTTADTGAEEEKAKRRLVRAAAATKRLLKSENAENASIENSSPDIAVVETSSETAPKKVPRNLKPSEEEQILALKKKETFNEDDSVIDLTSDTSPVEKKKR